MSSRRSFVKTVLGGLALAGIQTFPLDVLGSRGITKLTVLHTNDVHSRIDPFPLSDPKYPGLGGFARRAALIEEIRRNEKNVLVLDAGDIFQGTPYFNLYGGELELKLMSKMGYDAATIGNHDFDNGIDGLANQLKNMNFPFLNANYSFLDTPLENKTKEYTIFKKGGLKIGVFGIGIELKGLVDTKQYGKTRYYDPLPIANRIATTLKHDHKCDLVICLSHLGYTYTEEKICDVILAKKSANIDLIIGGHTHTFLDHPVSFVNTEGKEVQVAQVGWAGIRLGRIDFYFDANQRKRESTSSTVKVCENAIA